MSNPGRKLRQVLGPEPLEHPLFKFLDATGVDARDFATNGIRWTSQGRAIDAFYKPLWKKWAAQQSPPPPKGHSWVKGTVATGLVLAERANADPKED